MKWKKPNDPNSREPENVRDQLELMMERLDGDHVWVEGVRREGEILVAFAKIEALEDADRELKKRIELLTKSIVKHDHNVRAKVYDEIRHYEDARFALRTMKSRIVVPT